MIELYYTNITNLNREYNLADWQKKKAEKYKKKEDYLRSVAASLLVNTVLFDGLPAPLPTFGDYGKPSFYNTPEFNLSHAGDFAVLAVAPKPVGIDIEQKTQEDYLSIGKAFLCKQEYNLLEKAVDRRALFYEFWTRKESYLKMTGMGLHRDPKSFCAFDEHSQYNFFIRKLSPGYAVAICSSELTCAENFKILTF